MSTKETLNDLIQLDIDAVYAYEKALEHITDSSVAQKIRSFKEDHEQHIVRLSAAVRDLGGEPPNHKPDVKGYLIEGFTAMRSMTGTEGALKAMRTNEKTTNKKYEDALQSPLSAEIEAIVRSNLDDERRHLKYIEQAIDRRVWESGSGARI